jgi:hypothetical protein
MSSTEATPQTIEHNTILYYELNFSDADYSKILNLVSANVKTDGIYFKTNDELHSDLMTDEDIGTTNKKFPDLLKSMKHGEKVLVIGDNVYKLNDGFHITVLYTGGKADKKAEDLYPLLGNKYSVTIEKIGFNSKFITAGVSINDGLPYHGNPVKHITLGLNKFSKEKIFPKDSYTALLDETDGNTIVGGLQAVEIEATFDAFRQKPALKKTNANAKPATSLRKPMPNEAQSN